MADIAFAALALFVGLPALYLLYLSFTKQPPVSPGSKHWSRWLWYAVQAAVFLVLSYWLISINADEGVRPGVVIAGAAALTFYLVFAVAMYTDLAKRIWRWRSPDRQRRIDSRRG